MKYQKTILSAVVIGVVLTGVIFGVNQLHEQKLKERTAIASSVQQTQIDRLSSKDQERLIKCWVRENAEKGYDKVGHRLPPASVALNKMSLNKTDKQTWQVTSDLFEGKDKTYVVTRSGQQWEMKQAQDKKDPTTISDQDLYSRYKDQIK